MNAINISTRDKYIIGAVTFVLFINFVVAPFIDRQKAVGVIKSVLNSWVAEDAAAAIRNFKDPIKSPPIYNLKSYKIKKMTIVKEDGVLIAKFSVMLELEENNIYPSGKTWTFKLERTERHWMIASYSIDVD